MINSLIEALNTSGATFVQHVWHTQPSTDYGTVTISQETMQWADNRPWLRRLVINVNLYTYGSGEDRAADVERIMTEAVGVRGWVKTATEYLQGEDLMRHGWQVVMSGRV